jgi:hypothetical protein
MAQETERVFLYSKQSTDNKSHLRQIQKKEKSVKRVGGFSLLFWGDPIRSF